MKKLMVLVLATALLSGCMMYKSHNQRISGTKAIVPVSSTPAYSPYGYYGNRLGNWRLDGYCHTPEGLRISCPGVYPINWVGPSPGVVFPTPTTAGVGTVGVGGKGKGKQSTLTPEKYMGSKVIPLSCKTGDAEKDSTCITSLAEKLGQEQESCATGGSCPKDYDPSRWQRAKDALFALGEDLSEQ